MREIPSCELPAKQRAAWRAMFDHYVFQTGDDPAAHIPAEVAGILGPVTADAIAQMRKSLIDALERDAACSSGGMDSSVRDS